MKVSFVRSDRGGCVLDFGTPLDCFVGLSFLQKVCRHLFPVGMSSSRFYIESMLFTDTDLYELTEFVESLRTLCDTFRGCNAPVQALWRSDLRVFLFVPRLFLLFSLREVCGVLLEALLRSNRGSKLSWSSICWVSGDDARNFVMMFNVLNRELDGASFAD